MSHNIDLDIIRKLRLYCLLSAPTLKANAKYIAEANGPGRAEVTLRSIFEKVDLLEASVIELNKFFPAIDTAENDKREYLNNL